MNKRHVGRQETNDDKNYMKIFYKKQNKHKNNGIYNN